jgi:hypothetical protein
MIKLFKRLLKVSFLQFGIWSWRIGKKNIFKFGVRIYENSIIGNNNYICILCGKKADCVHHKNYYYIMTDDEINHCICLCNECHENIHKIDISYEKKCSKCGYMNDIEDEYCMRCDSVLIDLNEENK